MNVTIGGTQYAVLLRRTAEDYEKLGQQLTAQAMRKHEIDARLIVKRPGGRAEYMVYEHNQRAALSFTLVCQIN